MEQTPRLISYAMFLGVLLTCSFKSNGQSVELGAFVGYSNYMGDLQKTHFESDEARMAGGVFTRLNFNDWIALKTHFYTGKISGSDRNYTTETFQARNLSFKTDLYELGIQGEISFVNFGEKKKIASVYGFGGVAGVYFNPKALYNNEWVELQPIGTEGQGMPGYDKPYSRYTVTFPMGLGFKVNVANVTSIGLEIGFRKTLTDYLDDVSGQYPDLDKLREINPMAADLSYRTPEYMGEPANYNPVGQNRGDSSNKDLYFFCGVTFSTYIYRVEWR